MKGIIEHIDLLPDGVVVIFADGREAWLSQELDCRSVAEHFCI